MSLIEMTSLFLCWEVSQLPFKYFVISCCYFIVSRFHGSFSVMPPYGILSCYEMLASRVSSMKPCPLVLIFGSLVNMIYVSVSIFFLNTCSPLFMYLIFSFLGKENIPSPT